MIRRFSVPSAILGEVLLVLGRAELLSGMPRDEHFAVCGVRLDHRDQPSALVFGEALAAGAQDGPDSVERVALLAAVPARF